MRTADHPANERERAAALDRLGVVGTAPDPDFDRIVRLAATLLDAPIAYVSFVTADRSWFKARVGLDIGEVPRDASFCAHTLESDGGLIVPDTWLDDRFEHHPLVVGSPRARSYAGVTVRAPGGEPVGTLAVVDRVPKSPDPRRLQALLDLATMAEDLLARRDDPIDGDELRAPASVVDDARVQQLELVLEQTTDVVIVVDPTGKIRFASDSLTRVLGHDAGSLPDGAFAMVHPDDRPLARKVLSAVVDGTRGAEPFVIRVNTGTGSLRHMECTAVSRFDRPAIGGVVVTMRDVSERHMLSQMVSFQATHDRLTELPNYTLLQEHIRQALARAGREGSQVALCRIDMVGFQELNDHLGHSAGDELLVDVARRIRSSIRAGDSAARLGGDEFAVLLDPVATPEEALMVGQRIVNAVSGPHSLRDGVSDCGANAGIAVSATGDDPATLMARAGRALSAARSSGEGAVQLGRSAR